MPPDTTPFACSYRHGEETWCFTVHAIDWADATARLRAIGVRGQVDGVLMATIPVLPSWRQWWKALTRLATGAER